MRTQTIGRVLGIGVRIAGRAAGRYIAGETQPAHASRQVGTAAVSGRANGQTAGRMTVEASRGVARGIGGFLRPFGRVGGIVWLEVTGVFFLLPVLVFAPMIWSSRLSWAHGPDHRKFISSAIVVVIFLYLGITSFWRAHKRSTS